MKSNSRQKARNTSNALLSLSCCSLLSLPCRLPVAASPVALLSSFFRFPVAYPVAMSCFLLLPCRHPDATLSPPCRPPVAHLSQHPCRLPVACLSLPVAFLPLSCRFPVVCLSPACRHSVATLSPSCRSLAHFTVACFARPESMNASVACVSFLRSRREGVLCATLVIQGIRKGGRQPIADLVGQPHPEGGGLGFLKLQLQKMTKDGTLPSIYNLFTTLVIITTIIPPRRVVPQGLCNVPKYLAQYE